MIKGKYYKLIFGLLLLFTFLFGKFQGGFISWFLFFMVGFMSIYLWAVGKYSLKEMKITRRFVRNRVTAGDDIVIEIELWNRTEFPHAYLIVIDDKPNKLNNNNSNNEKIIYPWFRSKSFIRYTIPNANRGMHKWKDIEIITGDIFGIIQIRRVYRIYSEVIVYPKSFPIRKWSSMNARNIGSTFSQNKMSEDTASVVGIREYRKGDRFNRIHWRQSAKAMQLMTKEFERFTTNDFMLLLNQEKHVYKHDEHFEKSVELVASLAMYCIDNRFKTGFVSEGISKRAIPLSRGKEHIMRIFEALAVIENDVNLPFANIVKREIPHLPVNVTLVLITPSINEDLYYMLAELGIRKVKVEVFLTEYSSEDSNDVEGISALSQVNISINRFPITNINKDKEQGGIRIGL